LEEEAAEEEGEEGELLATACMQELVVLIVVECEA
jgi:hypothetical protein